MQEFRQLADLPAGHLHKDAQFRAPTLAAVRLHTVTQIC